MVFSGLPFLFVFLPLTLIVYYLLPRRAKNGWLLLSSLFFYGYGEPVFLLLMLGSILFNYLCGLAIGALKKQGARSAVLVLAVTVDLGALGLFKYLPWLCTSLRALPVFSFLPVPELALPIGISFYTFQALSYVIDVWRGSVRPQKDPIAFGTFLALFPQLIAGPIVRYADVEAQLKERRETWALFSQGVRLFTVGLAKKVLLADVIGQLWTSLSSAPGGAAGRWIGVIAFTLQLYLDFSGYSDMARGLGHMFGFRFVKNFDYPLCASSITDFWRRWHISLGTWFREYVYIPLGGNRKGKARTALNLLLVWLLTGLWHGASWNFVIWGLYFGVLLVLEKLLSPRLPRVLSHIVTLFFVLISWEIFAIEDVPEMLSYLAGMFTFSARTNAETWKTVLRYLPVLLTGILASLPLVKNAWLKTRQTRAVRVLEPVITACLLLLCFSAAVASRYSPFLYFRF